MNKHTPGPWRWAGPCLNSYAHNAPGRAAMSPYEILSHVEDPAGTPSVADARLIAAAPDLLEALVQFVVAYETDDELEAQRAHSTAKAALAKARGTP